MNQSKKINWEIVAKRGLNLPFLLLDGFMDSISDVKNFQKEQECNFRINFFRQFDGARFFEKSELKKYQKFIWKKGFNDPDYWKRLASRFLEHQNSLHSLADSLDKNKNIISSSYLQFFICYRDLLKKVWTCVYDYILINPLWTEYLKRKYYFMDSDQKYIEYCSSSARPLESHFEQTDFDSLRKNFIPKAIKIHLDKYRHFGMYYFFGNPWTKADLLTRMKGVNETAKLPKSLSRDLFLKWSLKRKVSKKDMALISAVKELAYAAQMIHMNLTKTILALEPLWLFIARESNLKGREEVSWLTLDEVNKIFQGNKSFLRSLDITSRSNSDYRFIKGRRILSFPKDKEQEIVIKNKELKGTIASSGDDVEGKVFLIHHINDTKLVKNDSILVMVSAFPAYAPAITKARAVITENAGMLSHAAVIAREHKKLAVVGVNNAIKILKNNQRVRIIVKNNKATIVLIE